LEVGRGYPNFGLVIQKVVHRISDADGDLLEQMVRGAGTFPAPPVQEQPTVVPQPEQAPIRPASPELLRELHHAHQRIGLLERKVLDLEALLALAGPNLEDYLRLAHSSQGSAFEEATRKCFVALGFTLDQDYQGQAGEIDFVATAPYWVFGECQASGLENVSVAILDKLMRHRRRYLSAKNIRTPISECRVVISEFATDQLNQDAREVGAAILRPSQLAALLKLKREYPGSVHPYNIRAALQQPGDITPHVVSLIDRTREEIEKRVGIIEVLKNDRFIRVSESSGRDPGWIQARVESELEAHMPLREVEQVLRELTSPLVGCVGAETDSSGRALYYYIRDYDFQVVSIAPALGVTA
jgi:hypothetical protein